MPVNKSMWVWLVVSALSLLVLVITLCATKNTQQTTFIPPEFDANAQPGVPVLPESWPYGTAKLGEYELALATNILLKEKNAYIYFANLASNDVWMKLRILDSTGKQIGESGLIKPNEYLEKVSLQILPDEEEVTIKVMCYEPGTYHSKGSSQVTLPMIVVNQ